MPRATAGSSSSSSASRSSWSCSTRPWSTSRCRRSRPTSGSAPPNLQWVINAYTLVFGGFLLLGGRAGDLFGRRRLFLAGVAIFSAASLLNGLATSRGLARRRPRAPGPRRRARLPRRAVDHHHHLRGGRGAHEGARRLERDRGRRRRLRPAARRHPHRPAELGVDLLRQRADRPRHRGARDPLRAGVARAEPPRQRRPARRGQRHRGPRRARLRDRQGGGLRLGLREDARPVRRRGRAPDRVRVHRAQHQGAADPARDLPGALARRREPDPAARDRRPVRVLLLQLALRAADPRLLAARGGPRVPAGDGGDRRRRRHRAAARQADRRPHHRRDRHADRRVRAVPLLARDDRRHVPQRRAARP